MKLSFTRGLRYFCSIVFRHWRPLHCFSEASHVECSSAAICAQEWRSSMRLLTLLATVLLAVLLITWPAAHAQFASPTVDGITANAQKLSPEEQKIVKYVDAHSAEAVALLEKVVNIESATQNLAGVKQVGEVFKNEFAGLGLTARWIDMPAEMNRAGHLIAETSGTRGK